MWIEFDNTWIEFDKQFINFKHITKIQITEKDSKFAVNVIGTFACEKELFDTEEQAQERYEEIKYLLTGKNDKWYFVKVNDENEGIFTRKFPIKKERNKWLKENETYMKIIKIWEQEVPLQW